jgi:Cysteine-rich secretory protein family
MSISTARRGLAAPLVAALLLATLPALHLQLAGAATTTVGGTFHALTPSRILDTRQGSSPLGSWATRSVQIAGHGGVPSTGVSAVVLNVTATNTTAAGFLTMFPTGVARPLASNLNWGPGETVAKLVTVGLGSGAVSAYNGPGAANLIFDVAGYYSTPDQSPGPAGLFHPLVPSRLLDTRSGNGAPAAKLGPKQTLELQVTGRGGVPSSGVAAVVLNVTATDTSTAGFLTVFPAGLAVPLASTLNFVAGATVPNRVMVGLGSGGKVGIYNGAGTTDVVADVNGWFTDGTAGGTGGRFTPLTPTRILDSRYGTGGYWTAWGPDSGRSVAVAGMGGVPLMTDPNPPTAIVANLTVTDTTAPGALTAWPAGAARPMASDVNWPRGGTVPNPVIVQVGPTGSVDLYNYAGCADVVMDVVGWFTGPLPTITAAAPPTPVTCSSPSSAGWLARLNFWRSTAGLPRLTENSTWSNGDYLHAVYMIKNQLITHYETVGIPYYTAAGALAAQDSNIEVMSSTSFTDEQAIDWWMGAPFHAMGMMDPRLKSTGFGAYREVRSGFEAGFALDVIHGNSFTGGTFPVEWPGNGTTVPLRSYSGNEWPDPLQACSGYSMPVGLPVFIEVGGNVSTTATAVSFTGNGAALEHCVIDSHNTAVGSFLYARGGVIVIPRAPLKPGVSYVVTLTVNGVLHTWKFEVS